MKRLKSIASIFALALMTQSVRTIPVYAEGGKQGKMSEEAHAKISREYKEYLLDARNKNDKNLEGFMAAIEKYKEKEPDFMDPYLDIAELLFKYGRGREAYMLAASNMSEAKTRSSFLPDSENGKYSRARFHRFESEVNLYIYGNEKSAAESAEECAKYNAGLGAQAFYNLANNYITAKNFDKAFFFYKKAFEFDKELAYVTGDDIKAFGAVCNAQKKFLDLAAFYDQYIAASKTCYYQDFGAQAMSAYGKAKRKDKAVLVSVLDKEYTLSYSDTSADELIAILSKNYGKDKDAKTCIAFVKKFYDKDSEHSQADLDALPDDVKDFLPVRYMFNMKNSNDIERLEKDFDVFVGTAIGNYYIRLYDKAEKAGDKNKMAQIKETMKGKRYNEHGKNRLNATSK